MIKEDERFQVKTRELRLSVDLDCDLNPDQSMSQQVALLRERIALFL